LCGTVAMMPSTLRPTLAPATNASTSDRRHVDRHDDAIAPAIVQRLRDAGRRFHLRDRIADDRDDARFAAELRVGIHAG
jgi:hypothetical protein